MRKLIRLSFVFFIATFSLAAQEIAHPDLIGKAQAQRFPFSMIGQLIFASGRYDFQGTGTVIYSRSVLTAAHNLWDSRQGWSTNVEFNRARYGRRIDSQTYARRLYVFGGYSDAVQSSGASSARAFARDLGGIRFSTPPGNGSFAGWTKDTTLLTDNSYNIALGYGADNHSGDELLSVSPSRSFRQALGAFLENESLTFEGGMSGGPVFAEVAPGDLRVVAVIVAGSDDPPTGGVRAISEGAARFIRTYLLY